LKVLGFRYSRPYEHVENAGTRKRMMSCSLLRGLGPALAARGEVVGLTIVGDGESIPLFSAWLNAILGPAAEVVSAGVRLSRGAARANSSNDE
jgi:hypothetical protein